MISYFQDYVTVGAMIGLGLVLFLVFISVSALLSPKKPTPEKVKTYECGVDPVGGGWSQTYVRYYIFGLLFVIFDSEDAAGATRYPPLLISFRIFLKLALQKFIS